MEDLVVDKDLCSISAMGRIHTASLAANYSAPPGIEVFKRFLNYKVDLRALCQKPLYWLQSHTFLFNINLVLRLNRSLKHNDLYKISMFVEIHISISNQYPSEGIFERCTYHRMPYSSIIIHRNAFYVCEL